MEFDFDAAHRSGTADAADFRTARVITLDGKAFHDSESIYVHIKRAAVFTVETEQASLQKVPQEMD